MNFIKALFISVTSKIEILNFKKWQPDTSKADFISKRTEQVYQGRQAKKDPDARPETQLRDDPLNERS